MSSQKQKLQQREAMERKRFGFTRAEIFKVKGARCVIPGGGHAGDLVIDHIKGGGRHDTERGIITKDTHSMKNLRVLCRKHAGMVDRADFLKDAGRNSKGNPNNPSQ